MSLRPTLSLLAVAMWFWPTDAIANTGDPVLLNEIFRNPDGDDTTEFAELFGIPGTSLAGLSLIAIENDLGSGSLGTIESRYDFEVGDEIGANGFFLVGDPAGLSDFYSVTPNVTIATGFFENSAATIAIVETASIPASGVITPDNEDSIVVRDAVAVFEDNDTGQTSFLGAPTLFGEPEAIVRASDGIDTNVTEDWLPLNDLTDDTKTPTPGGSVLLNEVLGNHIGADNTEFIELFGTPGLPLNGLSVILLENDDANNLGAVDRRIDLGGFSIATNSFFLIGNPVGLVANYGIVPDLLISNDTIENSDYTIALVRTATLSAQEGDVVTGEESVLDAVAVVETGTFPPFYNAPALGPDGTFLPAGVRRVTDGVDTDTAEDWVIADFNLTSQDNPNTPISGAGTLDNAQSATIMAIQGNGPFSPLIGALVETQGVVTNVTSGGFWLQDPTGDDDVQTSDGVFVLSSATVNIGDLVTVVGFVDEEQFGTALPRTLVSALEIEAVQSGVSLPTPVAVTDVPNESIAEGIAFWEPLEGMLVSVDGTVVASPSAFGEFALLVDANTTPGSGYESSTSQIFLREVGPGVIDYNPERIIVDDATLDVAPVVYPGDLVALTGNVDYSFGNYKLQPDPESLVVVSEPPVLTSPVSQRRGAEGDFSIVTYNVENLFDLVDNPDKDDEGSTPSAEELETKLTKLTLAFIDELNTPTIAIVQEVENTQILQELADRINTAAGTAYEATSEESSDGRGIEVGFLVDTHRATLLDAFQLSGPDVEAAFGPESASPGREPLVGLFAIGETEFTIVGNHFKSKGGDDPLFTVNDPQLRITEEQRVAQAQAVRNFLNGLFTTTPDALVLVAGDLNDFPFGEAGEDPHPVGVLEGTADEVSMTNLIHTLPADSAFTFVFDGNSQVLDHMLLSPAFVDQVASFNALHFNAAFPASLGEDSALAVRSSDHDALEGRFFEIVSNGGSTSTGGETGDDPNLGSEGSDGEGTGGADDGSGGADESDDGGSGNDDAGSAGAGDDGSDDGCNCSVDASAPPSWMLLFVAFGLVRLRRRRPIAIA